MSNAVPSDVMMPSNKEVEDAADRDDASPDIGISVVPDQGNWPSAVILEGATAASLSS